MKTVWITVMGDDNTEIMVNMTTASAVSRRGELTIIQYGDELRIVTRDTPAEIVEKAMKSKLAW